MRREPTVMVTPPKLRSLLLTPVTPAMTGNGLAMRAAAIRNALAALGQVDTLLAPVAEQPGQASGRVRTLALNSSPRTAASWLSYARGRKLLTSITNLPTRARLAPPGILDEYYLSRDYDVVYVLRLYLAGLALPLMARSTETHFLLDLDEDDAAVAKQIGNLLEKQGKQRQARHHWQESIDLESFANACLPWFDTVAYSTRTEAMARQRTGINQITLPNTINCDGSFMPSEVGSPPRLLFVGNLDYQPNQDAVFRLISSILPELRCSDSLTELWVVGAGGLALKEAYGDKPGVVWMGYLQDLKDVYSSASVAVVPLRAGGGSRLKILEAMACGLPVVATPKAVEGLNVLPNQHFLLADTDSELVEAVKQLANRPELGNAIARAAFNFVQEEHSPGILESELITVLKN